MKTKVEDKDRRAAEETDGIVGVVVDVAVVQADGQGAGQQQNRKRSKVCEQEVMAEEKRVGWKKQVRAMEVRMRAAEEEASSRTLRFVRACQLWITLQRTARLQPRWLHQPIHLLRVKFC